MAKVRKDLKEWEQIERLIAIKIGDVEELGESASSQESPGSAVVSYEDTDGTCDASLAIESDDEPESNGSTQAFDFHGMTYAQVAEFALKRLGRPARASEIRDELLSLGYVVNKDSKVATNILYNSLDRSKRVSRTSDGRWSLAGESHDGIGEPDESFGDNDPDLQRSIPTIVSLSPATIIANDNRWMSFQEIARAIADQDVDSSGDTRSYARKVNETLKEYPQIFEHQGTFYRVAGQVRRSRARD